MTDYDGLEPYEIHLREHVFKAKPLMSAKDFGLVTALGTAMPEGNLFEILSGVARRTLTGDSRKAWDDLWEQDLDVPISFKELAEFVNVMAEREADRPTVPLSPSGNSGESTPTRSTENSSSRADVRSIPSRSVPV